MRRAAPVPPFCFAGASEQTSLPFRSALLRRPVLRPQRARLPSLTLGFVLARAASGLVCAPLHFTLLRTAAQGRGSRRVARGGRQLGKGPEPAVVRSRVQLQRLERRTARNYARTALGLAAEWGKAAYQACTGQEQRRPAQPLQPHPVKGNGPPGARHDPLRPRQETCARTPEGVAKRSANCAEQRPLLDEDSAGPFYTHTCARRR